MTTTPSARARERLFDPQTFAQIVDLRISRQKLSQREAAKQVGISAATMNRVLQGKAPDIETYLRIKRWIEEPAIRENRP